MRLLLDSHAFVWYALGHSGCSPAARRAIEADDSETFFSAVTAWEIAIKMRAGRWPDAAPLLERLDEILQLHRFRPLPISVAHARTARLLHGDHKDPFDRMLAAQAIVDDLTLVTADKVLRTLGPTILW